MAEIRDASWVGFRIVNFRSAGVEDADVQCSVFNWRYGVKTMDQAAVLYGVSNVVFFWDYGL